MAGSLQHDTSALCARLSAACPGNIDAQSRSFQINQKLLKLTLRLNQFMRARHRNDDKIYFPLRKNSLSISTPNNRYEALDAFRGICACLVALYHFPAYSHIYDLPFLRNSLLFVDFFFVLSGFVIFANYYERLQLGFGVLRFMLLRLARLYPLHLFVLVLYLGFDLLQVLVPPLADYATVKPFSGPGENVEYIIANLLLIHSLGLFDYLALNTPSWSISTEFYAYIFFAYAIVLLRNRIPGLLVASIIAVSIFLVVNNPPYYLETTAQYGFLRCLMGFSAGALVWMLFDRYSAFVRGRINSVIVWTAVEIAGLFAVVLFVSLSPQAGEGSGTTVIEVRIPVAR
jgi:peptidoglycan/LPS O-acetylase OafA/YrhL